MKTIHYRGSLSKNKLLVWTPCGLLYWKHSISITDNKKKVTCKNCLRILLR